MDIEDEISKIKEDVTSLKVTQATTCTQLNFLQGEVKEVSTKMDALKNMYNDHLKEQVDLKFKEKEEALNRRNAIYVAITAGAFGVITYLLNVLLH